jgi:hypothetical protein
VTAGTMRGVRSHWQPGNCGWPERRAILVFPGMLADLPPPAWKKAVESDAPIALIVLVLAIAGMAVEAFAR